MYRASTPTLYFHIKNMESLEDIEKVLISFRNRDDVTNILEKTEEDVTINDEDKTISVTLTQKETLLFTSKFVSVQLRVKLNDGKSIPSAIKEINIERILNESIM